MRYYYTDAANQPVGPCELEQLQALAAEGKITDSTSVIPEGAQVWTTYGAVKPGGIPPVPPAPRAPVDPFKIATIMGDTVATVLAKLTGWLTPALLKRSLAWAERYGHFAVIVGCGLGLIVALITSIRTSTVSGFMVGGVAFVLAIAVAQFSAMRFISAGSALIAAAPTRLANKSFLECVALFAVLGAAGLLISGVVTAIKYDQFLPLIPAVLLAVLLTYIALIALHPDQVNVGLESGASAGEEAIAVFSFFTKVWLRLVPLFFCLFVMLGALATAFSLSERGAATAEAMLGFIPMPPALTGGAVGMAVLLYGCLLPVLIYLGFLLSYLLIDLLRAILSIPGKLDALKK
jgi:hypothetical protein